jgi:outer membrane PBP1 activator LpoA protein
MLTTKQFARRVALKIDSTADRYTQIGAIKEVILATDQLSLASDRETIDGILDILYHDYAFCG